MTISRRTLLKLALFAQAPLWGMRTAFAAPASRIITLGGDVTEIVYALGAGSRIVGRDSTSIFPQDANALANVGYFRQLGAEGVLSLKPDLILASSIAGPSEVLKQISSAGVRIVQMADDRSPKGLLAKVATIASALEITTEATAFSETLKTDFEKANDVIAKLEGHPRVLFLMNAGDGAPMAAGRDTSADALINLVGGVNVFSAYTGYKPISLEASAAAAPDAIALMEQTLASMGGVEGVAQHPALRLTPAAKSRRIFGRDGSYLLSFGPRLPKAMVDFAYAIHRMGAP